MTTDRENKQKLEELKTQIHTLEWDKKRNQLNAYKETLLKNLKNEYKELNEAVSD
jgi:hypothetical protein